MNQWHCYRSRIRSDILPGFVLLALLVTASAPCVASAQGAVIQFGETYAGAISASGEVARYTFLAKPGDTIFIAMTRVSGSLWQRIQLYDPDGTLLADEESPVHVEVSHSLPTRLYLYLPKVSRFQIDRSSQSMGPQPEGRPEGIPRIYTLLLSDGFNGTRTGSYNLFLQRLNSPVGATAISPSQTLSGNITQPAEINAFTLSTNTGDTFLVVMNRVAGDLWQQIRIYSPDGDLLREESSPVHAEIAHTMLKTGDFATRHATNRCRESEVCEMSRLEASL